MTEPFNTQNAQQIADSSDGDLLRDAANIVQRLAPAPVEADVEPDEWSDYVERAARCERRLYRYYSETGNTQSSGLPGGLSDTYKTDAETRKIVREVMGRKWYGTGRAVPII